MVTVGLFAIIISVAASLYSLAQRSYNKSEDKMELVQNSRVAYDRMSREIRQSVKIVTDLSSDPASSTNEIMFQNGHDDSNINYIYYYLDGSDLRRARLVYYFEEEPNNYVKYDSTNKSGDLPQQKTQQDQVISEYFKNIEFWGEKGLVNSSSTLAKDDEEFSLQTSVSSRNY